MLPRFAAQGWRGSRLLTAFLMLCLLPPLVAAVIIYVFNNPLAQGLLGLGAGTSTWNFRIDGQFFACMANIQGSLAFLLVAWVGPGLVAPDLANNALPLYLSRPFSRAGVRPGAGDHPAAAGLGDHLGARVCCCSPCRPGWPAAAGGTRTCTSPGASSPAR